MGVCVRPSNIISQSAWRRRVHALADPLPASLINDAPADKRYRAQSEVPRSVLESMHSDVVHSPGFSIKGEARQGRAAYLDFQATTPMDPRVVDAMVTEHDVFMCTRARARVCFMRVVVWRACTPPFLIPPLLLPPLPQLSTFSNFLHSFLT